MDTNEEGHRRLKFLNTPDILEAIDEIGEVPLPPYIARDGAGPGHADRERYQTVYAQARGSVAAPTAGLHCSEQLLSAVRQRGVQVCFVTLHVGLGTFAPVKVEHIGAHRLHEERFEVPVSTARLVNEAKSAGRRVVAVGTTSVRVLETVAARHAAELMPGPGRTRIFLYPPCDFKVVDALLTNFHLQRSTLLMLAAAFATPGQTTGREVILRAYAERTQVVFATGMSSEALTAQLAKEKDVEYAVPDRRKARAAVANDEYYLSGPPLNLGLQTGGPVADQWYLRPPTSTFVSAINAEQAWDLTTGNSNVVVAVLDTGVRFDHPDLAGKLVGGFDFVGPDRDAVGNLIIPNTYITAKDGNGYDANARATRAMASLPRRPTIPAGCSTSAPRSIRPPAATWQSRVPGMAPRSAA